MSHHNSTPLPLQSINQNISSPSTPSSIPPKRLAPIFTRTYSRPTPSPPIHIQPSSSSSTKHASSSRNTLLHSSPTRRPDENDAVDNILYSRKRVRLNPPSGEPIEVDENEAKINVGVGYGYGYGYDRYNGIPDYFVNNPIRGEAFDSKDASRKVVEVDPRPAPSDVGSGVWRRKRGRMGVSGSRGDTLLNMATARYQPPEKAYLETFVTSLIHSPITPPSLILLPSIHPWSGHPRDYAPPITVAFSHAAKRYPANTTAGGSRRLMGVANEEGGIRIVDVDEGTGMSGMEGGWWWRGHGNAVFDLKWSGDDSRILTTSGDQTARIHALTSPTPTLTATLKGHTSSIKTATFMNPDIPHTIATAGRDGNILIYDLRTPGRIDPSVGGVESTRRRGRYNAGVDGWEAQVGGEIGYVASIKGAHGDGGRRGSIGRTSAKSVTSLVALQNQPGILASGGSYDGIVKLWDLRSLTTSRSTIPSHTLPDPTQTQSTSRRPRAIHSMVESPTTGDLYTLCGDSKIHVLRPSISPSSSSLCTEAIQPKSYMDSNLIVSGFYSKVAISPCGRWLSSGSSKGGLMAWDVAGRGDKAVRLGMGLGGVAWPEGREREISAVDWGVDLIAGCSDDYATRIWRPDGKASEWLEREPEKAGVEWAGMIR